MGGCMGRCRGRTQGVAWVRGHCRLLACSPGSGGRGPAELQRFSECVLPIRRQPPPSPPRARPPQGCWQLCLEELLGGSDPTAATFLAGGCGPLKSALGLEPLFLMQYAADPSLYTQDGMQCIWCVLQALATVGGRL